MSCPFLRLRERTAAKVSRIGHASRAGPLGRIIGQRLFAECVLAVLLLVTGVCWYIFQDDMTPALHRVVVPAGAAIDLLLYFIIHTLTRREKAIEKKAAILSEEIQRSAERYRAVVDTAADAIVLADQHGVITSFNRAAEKIFGYAAHEVLGRNVHVLLEEGGAAAHDDHIKRFVDTGTAHVVGIGRDVEGRRKDGTLFPLHLSLASWRDGPGEIGFTAIMSDVTEQRNAQRALEKSKHQLQTFMDCATDFAIYQLDLENRVVKWNKGAEAILGYSAAEMDGLHIDRLFPEEDVLEGRPGLIMKNAIIYGRQETEGWQLRKDGRIFWASGVVQPIFDGSEVTGMAVILRDQTARRAGAELLQLAKEQAEAAASKESELRNEIEASNLELKDANEKLQKFASIVAHDLRAPLKRIDAFIDALREDYAGLLDTEGKEMLTRINRGAVRMKLMLDSMLDYSRYNAEAFSGKTADLPKVIKDVIDNCDFHQFEACIRVNADDVPHLRGDPVLLAHVFQNLIGNSIKFRRGDDLRIDIDVRTGPNLVTVSVTDNGIGIEPHFADQVFDMFYRLHNEDEYEGTGIGLTVCRKIINDHGGRIWVDKNYEGGTRIIMTLPSANDDHASQLSLTAA
jgi:PAS domain S-box-containing protein